MANAERTGHLGQMFDTFAHLVTLRRALLIGAIGWSSVGVTAAAQGTDDSFAASYERLRRGPDHVRDVPTGRLEHTRTNENGLAHRYVLIVPEDYDPSRRYPVAFYLHGGVSRPDPGPGGDWWRNYGVIEGHDRIAVVPLSWNESSRDTTPWAAFLPFIGDPRVLLNPANGADGDVHLANLTNKPLFIVNNEDDPLYPVRQIIPFLGALESVDADFEFTPKPGGHNYNRAHWVVIDEVGPIAGDAERAGLASITSGGQGGIIGATRTGNAVTLRARAVRRFTLLISPDAFDLASPVRVVANGETVFEGMVRPDIEVLTKWAARDEDRTMLYAAEIHVDLEGTR